MSTWLYQMSQTFWNPQRYRIEIWEGQTWQWDVGKVISHGNETAPGDIVVFFYAKSGGTEAGFYGWAVILEWLEQIKQVSFRPVAPSDHLKMDPWWNMEAEKLSDMIRGSVKQATMWHVKEDLAKDLRSGMTAWLARTPVTKR
jgi:hypothetical protein